MGIRVLELFGGIGGLAEAAAPLGLEVVATVDHDRPAQAVYAANFPDHRREVKNLAAVKPGWLAAFEADLWWLSPPCAPHGIRGAQRDLDDPRSAALVNLVRALPQVRPAALALENVPGFAGSEAHAALVRACDAAGLVHRVELEVCPSALGLPVSRRRFYLVAAREPVALPERPRLVRPLADHLGDHPELRVPEALVARFGAAFHRVDPGDPQAETACFTRAYGRSPVYAGSYLALPDGGVRWFAPEEIARLHGHRAGFSFAGLGRAEAWKRVGNGLSVDVVRWLLGAVPPLTRTAGR